MSALPWWSTVYIPDVYESSAAEVANTPLMLGSLGPAEQQVRQTDGMTMAHSLTGPYIQEGSVSPDGQLAFNPVRRSGVPAVAVTRLSGSSPKVKHQQRGQCRCAWAVSHVADHTAATLELDLLLNGVLCSIEGIGASGCPQPRVRRLSAGRLSQRSWRQWEDQCRRRSARRQVNKSSSHEAFILVANTTVCTPTMEGPCAPAK
jgi:hypothetical protein